MQGRASAGSFFYVDANALYAFKSRGFGGETGGNQLNITNLQCAVMYAVDDSRIRIVTS